MLVFTKLTGIYDHIAIYILVFTHDTFTHDTGIYIPYWYLCTILVFTHHTGIYAPYWYLRTIPTGIYTPYWYLRAILVFRHTILVFMCDTGIYAQDYSTQQ